MLRRIKLIVLTFLLAVMLLAIEVIIVKSAAKYEPEISVVYAKVHIPEGAVIQEGMLQERKVNISVAHRRSVRNIKDAVGKRARMDIEEGEMMLAGKLVSEGDMQSIRVEDKNSRLFSVEFKGDQANGWQLKAGQHVDIIFVPNEKAKASTEWQSGYAGSIQILRSVRVAALIDEKGRQLKNYEREVTPRYISFEVTDRQCEFLAFAKGNGRLEISVIPEE